MTSTSDGGPALGAARVGAELQAARHRLGWALPDVAARLRIRLAYLEAIEDGRVADLPGNAYAIGFLRSYASALGLDAAEVARRFRAQAQEVNRRTELAFPAPAPRRGVPAGAVVLLGVLLAGGAYVGWFRQSGQTRTGAEVPAVPDRLAQLADRAVPSSNPSPQVASILPPPGMPRPAPAAPAMAPPAAPAGSALPAAAPPAAAAPPSAASPPLPLLAPMLATLDAPPLPAVPPADQAPAPDAPRVQIRATADAWLQVRERGGPVLLSRLLRGGETWPVPRSGKLLLTTGNAGGTELLLDGVPGPSLGPAGALRRDLPLDGDPPAQPAAPPLAAPPLAAPQPAAPSTDRPASQ